MSKPIKTIQAEGIIAPDGSLILITPALLPLHPGQRVSMQITIPQEIGEAVPSLMHSLLHYETPQTTAHS